jgi:hypothetical protein
MEVVPPPAFECCLAGKTYVMVVAFAVAGVVVVGLVEVGASEAVGRGPALDEDEDQRRQRV